MMFRWVLCALPWGLPGCQPPPFWGITHPCNREAFGAEMYPSLKVSNIWRKLFCKIMQVQISHTITCAWDPGFLLPSRNYTLAPDEVTDEPVCDAPELCREQAQVFQPMRTQCVVNLPHQLSAVKFTEWLLSSFLHFHSVDRAQDPRVKQQLDGSRNIINNPENPFITATAGWFCGLTAQAKKDINTILCND